MKSLREMGVTFPVQVRYGDGVIVLMNEDKSGTVLYSPTERTREDWPVGASNSNWVQEYVEGTTVDYQIAEILG